MNLFINIIIGICLGIMRIAGEKGEFFQAVSHLYIGGLFVAWWLSNPPSKKYLYLGVILSLLELFVALHSRGII